MIIKEAITQFTPEKLLALINRLQAEGKIYTAGIDNERYESSQALVIEMFWEIIIRKFLVQLSQNESDYCKMEPLFKGENIKGLSEWAASNNIKTKDFLAALRGAYQLGESIKREAERINDELNRTEESDRLFYFVRHHSGHGVFGKMNRFISNCHEDLE